MWTFLIILIISIFILLFQMKYKFYGSQYLVFFIEVILLLCATSTPDYDAYQFAFVNNARILYEQGFYIVRDFLFSIGLGNFKIFLLLISVLLFTTFYLWNKETKRIHLVIFLYSLFCMYYDVIQIRYTIAQFIIIIAIYFLVKEKYFTCLVLCYLTTYFHRLSILIIIFIIYFIIIRPKPDFSLSKKEITFHLVFSIIFIFLSPMIINYISISIPLFDRVRLYLATGISIDSLVIWGFYLILIIVLLYYYGAKKALSPNNSNIALSDKRTINILFRFLFFGISTIGFLLYIDEFNRLYRSFYIISYILYAKLSPYIDKDNNKVIFILLTLINIVFMFVAISRGLQFDNYW